MFCFHITRETVSAILLRLCYICCTETTTFGHMSYKNVLLTDTNLTACFPGQPG